MTRVGGLALAALVLAGCSLPRDPEGTLQRATGGTIRAGVNAREPWARLEGEVPADVEVDLIEGFAREIDAEVRWLPGAEAELMAALETGQLDVIVGGLESTNPWAGSVTLTHPYLRRHWSWARLWGTPPSPTWPASRSPWSPGNRRRG